MPEFFWCFEAFRDLAGRFRWHNAVAFCRKVGERYDSTLLYWGSSAWLWLGDRAPAFTRVFTGSPA
jgi:hypothetical protein